MRTALLCIVVLTLVASGAALAETLEFASQHDLDEVWLVPGSTQDYCTVGPDGSTVWQAAVATWVHGSWPTMPGAEWISSAFYVEDPRNDSWRWFRRIVHIPDGAFGISGSITWITSDNAEVVYVNGVWVGADGEICDPHTDNAEWKTVKSYPTPPGALTDGDNVILFHVRNYRYPTDDVEFNPTGLIYSASISYSVALKADIDIKPGSDPNSINLGSGGVIPVAILGSGIFDVSCIDPFTVTMAGASVKVKGKSDNAGSLDDVNGDGHLDLVLQMVTSELTLTGDKTEAVVEGDYCCTDSGCYPFSGVDSVNIVP